MKDDPPHAESLQVKDYYPHVYESQVYSLGSPNTAEHHSSQTSEGLLHDQVSQILQAYNQIIVSNKWQKSVSS
jgi:hypothetical protein